MTSDGGRRVLAAGKLWRLAILTAAGALSATAEAQAAHHRGQKDRLHQANRIQAEAAKPQGPLIIAISIQNQKLRVYDANGFFAETPISTGMPGHLTPMGVFSVIQKQKLHHSNIYSGAPMPYMQRITWSGIAIHAGVLPGYPASHGCIRMPMAFAVKMWNWTKMGARVLVTPGEMTPASFSHPLLAGLKVVPQPTAAAEPPPDRSPALPSEEAVDAGAAAKPAISVAKLELRATVGQSDGIKVADASPSSFNGSLSGSTSARTGGVPSVSEDAVSLMAADAMNAGGRSGPPESEAATVGTRLVAIDTLDNSSQKPDAAVAASQPGGNEAIGSDQSGAQPKLEIKPAEATTETPKPDAPPAAGKPAASKINPAMAPAPKRSGQIAVFISRKDSKLYVRQNFEPLFDVPVTIAPSERPLGTHVFTAQIDKDDANVVHWSVVSLPMLTRHAGQRDETEHGSRGRKGAGAVEIKEMPVPDSPAEALDRLAIPADAMARINEALSTGGSIIVSDQGINSGETGEGTDFIVSLR